MDDKDGKVSLGLHERLEIFYTRLGAAPAVASAAQALDLVISTLVAVEDEHSGVPADPNPGLKYTGRMYPPRQDYTTEGTDGSINARTAGHNIHCDQTGRITITDRRSNSVVFNKAGRDR